jgi:asparagine synthase (glutamine-hydrolysing)
MSGYVGILHRDGKPLDANHLRVLAQPMSFRGPGAVHTWHRGAVGFAHGALVTDPGRDGERQPLGLDDRLWIAGHLRLDARQELIAALEGVGTRVIAGTQDAMLVLLGYRAWGEACMKRLHGDFSFAIWDAARQRLFCARDPFGVRPFFYAQFDDLFLFGNTLRCLRAHPRVSGRLYEPAVADYLAAGHLLEVDRTFFADIARLAPAHTLTVEPRGVTARRFWSLPVEPELRYRKDPEYVEHFAYVLSQALADRGGPGAAGLFMSGGVDSALLATVGAGKLGHGRSDLRGLCVGAGSEDPEPEFARLTSQALGMPLDILDEPETRPFVGWQQPEGAGPEPDYNPYRNTLLRVVRHFGQSTSVALNGQGGDEVLWPEYALDEARRANPLRVAWGVMRAWHATGRRPGLGLRLALEGWAGRAAAPWPSVPSWLNPGWARAAQIAERFRAFADRAGTRASLPRATARERLAGVIWTPYLESHDPGITGVALEVRWPYLDERVVRFALRLPVFPWCANKHVSRSVLRMHLPGAVVQRRKTAVTRDPLLAFATRHRDWHASVAPVATLPAYVDLARWHADCETARSASMPAAAETWARARVVGLNYWLGHEEAGHRPLFSPAPAIDRSSRSSHESQYA